MQPIFFLNIFKCILMSCNVMLCNVMLYTVRMLCYVDTVILFYMEIIGKIQSSVPNLTTHAHSF